MKKMKKIFLLPLLFALFAAPLPAAAEEEIIGDAEPIVWTLTAVLDEIQTLESGQTVLTLTLADIAGKADIEAADHCQYVDAGRRLISPGEFAKRYGKKPVIIDFMEFGPEEYIVVECRVR